MSLQIRLSLSSSITSGSELRYVWICCFRFVHALINGVLHQDEVVVHKVHLTIVSLFVFEELIVLVQEHAEVLTVSAPKEIVDVEGACQGMLGMGPYWSS